MSWRGLFLAALLALTPLGPALAWHEGGHIVVAQIAHDRLSPQARAEADRLIGVLADFAPVRADFVSAAVWLDDVKQVGWNAFDRWHFIDLPYNAEGLPNLSPVNSDNAVSAIEHALRTLRDERATDLAKAFSLRVLIHVVGDLHQPLHCVTRYAQASPSGDRGGNDFHLAAENLHYFWDEAGGLLGELDASSSSSDIAATVADLLIAVPEAALNDWRNQDPALWAREGYRLAVSVAYVGLVQGREPSEGYRIRAQLVAQRRLVKAGYRLAAMLEDLFGPPAGIEINETTIGAADLDEPDASRQSLELR